MERLSSTRDTNTGLITGSTDSSSHTTSYVYDGLGRLTSLTPSGEEATVISYDSPTQTTVTRTGTGGNTWERYQYDGLGRLIREKRQLGGTNAFSVRGHVYDAAGHEYYTSEWKPCTSDADCQSKTFTPAACPSGGSGAFGTTRCSYDPLGRPTKTIKADGSYVTVDRTDGSTLYSDTVETATTYNSGGTVAAGPYITKRDALGRVTSVVEPTVGSGADTTTYTYNVLDKLSGVTQGVQTRSFGYNAFGFLKSETNPENGTTTYTYGSQGDVLTKSVGGKSYSFTYDPAVRQKAALSGATTYHSFAYDASCSTFTTAPCGKLTSSIGYNPQLATAPTVTQSFTYTGVGGRMSARTTTINPTIAGSETFNEAWTYNTLGLVSVYTHPYPTGLSTVDSTYTYSNGYPAGLSSLGNTLVSNVAYLPDGRVGSSILGGTRTVTVSQDTSTYLPRPTDIKMQISGSTVWDSGTYTYDGAGNIKTIGSNTYGYDVRNRLTSSTVNSIPSTFTFDRYGNLTSAGATTASTNHLTSGTYDALGNLTNFASKSYTYDDFSRQKGYTTTGETYVYDASDERVARIPSTNTPWTVTLRDDGNKLASEYSLTSSGYAQSKDYYNFGNQLVTTLDWVTVNALYWVDDHLGTPRYGDETIGGHETHDYQPFGQEIGGSFGAQPLKFANMERDQSSGNDYDHARYDLTGIGRFLGVDQHSGRPDDPSTWNRYRYAGGNPLLVVDPDGREDEATMKMDQRGPGGAWVHANENLTPEQQRVDTMISAFIFAPFIAAPALALAPEELAMVMLINASAQGAVGAMSNKDNPGEGFITGELSGLLSGRAPGGKFLAPGKAAIASVIAQAGNTGTISLFKTAMSSIGGAMGWGASAQAVKNGTQLTPAMRAFVQQVYGIVIKLVDPPNVKPNCKAASSGSTQASGPCQQ